MREAINLLDEAIASTRFMLPYSNSKKFVFDRTFSFSYLQGDDDYADFIKFGASGAVFLRCTYIDAKRDVSLITKKMMRRLDDGYITYHEENKSKTYPLAFLGMGDIEAFVRYVDDFNNFGKLQKRQFKKLSSCLPSNKLDLKSYISYLVDIKNTLDDRIAL